MVFGFVLTRDEIPTQLFRLPTAGFLWIFNQFNFPGQTCGWMQAFANMQQNQYTKEIQSNSQSTGSGLSDV